MRVSADLRDAPVSPVSRFGPDFWDRMVGRCFWFTAGAISVLIWLDIGI